MLANLDLIKDLERIYQEFNKVLFDNQLKLPLIIVRLEKKVVLKFLPHHYQLIIGSNLLHSTEEEIIMSLLHQMIHIKNFSDDRKDLSKNQYHNNYFMNSALDTGFYVSKHRTRGWCLLTATPQEKIKYKSPVERRHERLKDVLAKTSISADAVKEAKRRIAKTLDKRQSRNSGFLKYICSCPAPHNSIRTGRRPNGNNPLKAICENCHQPFVCDEY